MATHHPKLTHTLSAAALLKLVNDELLQLEQNGQALSIYNS